MPINRREFIKTTATGATTLVMSPSFNHVLAASAGTAPQGADGPPHRFVFVRKSNGNLTSQFGLPSFSEEEAKMHKDKQAFEVGLAKQELPEWLRALDGFKDRMTILHGISMSVSGGGHYSYSGCMGAF